MAPHMVAIVDGAVVDPRVDPRVRRFRTLIAIVDPVVHSGRVDGPFSCVSHATMFLVFIRFHESRTRTVAR